MSQSIINDRSKISIYSTLEKLKLFLITTILDRSGSLPLIPYNPEATIAANARSILQSAPGIRHSIRND